MERGSPMGRRKHPLAGAGHPNVDRTTVRKAPEAFSARIDYLTDDGEPIAGEALYVDAPSKAKAMVELTEAVQILIDNGVPGEVSLWKRIFVCRIKAPPK
jgi:hypothetical protein